MEVSWRRIKEDTDKIVEEFDRVYTYERDYAECERIITEIFKVYSGKYNIQLDENEDFDHIFHELLSKIENITENFTPTDLSEQALSKKIDKLFEKMSEDIFQTAEIRGRLREIDPSNVEFKRALEQGIKEAEERKAQISEELDGVQGIYREMFGTEIPNLRVVTNAEMDDLAHFDIIEQKLSEIKDLQDAMSKMTPGIDDTDISNNQASIDRLTADIEEEKNRIRRTNLVDETRLNSISVNDITASLAEVDSLRTELDNRATADFTELQNNLANVKSKYSNFYAIAGIDFSKMDPSTEEGRKAIIDAYGPFLEIYEALEMDYRIYDKEIEIYNEQIKQIDEEEKILKAEAPTKGKIASEVPEDIKSRIDADMAYYEDMVDAQMYGDPEYKERYDKYLKIFKRHILSGDKKPSFILRDEEGNPELDSEGREKIGHYMTVDYDGIAKELKDSGMSVTTEELIKFLQLEDYKEKLERDSKVASGDKLAMTEYRSYKAFKNAKTQEELDVAYNALRAERAKDQLYLETFHYATNDYEFKKQHHDTAGKIGETYIPLQKHEKGEGVGQALKVTGHNIYAFTRWQNPFKAGSFPKGVLRTALNIGNLVTFFPRIITRATGHAISKYGYRDDKDPNPYNGRSDARRGARVAYYREHGDGAFVARVKGWMDQLGGRRGAEAEQAIMDRQLAEIRKGLEQSYVEGAYQETIAEIEEQKEIVRRNREIRAQDARKIASTKETQGDVIREPKEVDEKNLAHRTMQRVALEYADVDSEYVSNTASRDPAQNPQRNTQFEKEKPELKGKKEIKKIKKIEPGKTKWGRKKGSVVAADPIGRAIRSREIKNTLTRWYAVEQAALLMGQRALVKWGISKIKDTTMQTTGEWKETGRTERVADGGHYEDPGTTHKGVIGTQEGNTASRIKMGDLEYTDQAYFEHTADPNFQSVGWIEKPVSSNTQAMSLDYVVPSNLTPQEYQVLLSKYGLKAGDRISYSVADEATRNLCDATGRSYSDSYISGMFNFTDDTGIVDSINQYFPHEVSEPLGVILDSPNYAGDAGVNFLTESFATSHGISSVMKQMNSWGTGWGLESVNQEALEAARNVVDIIGDIPDDPVWIADYIDKPILEWVETTSTVIDPGKIALKKALNGVANGLTAAGYGSEIYDLVREAKTKKEPGRETYTREDR